MYRRLLHTLRLTTNPLLTSGLGLSRPHFLPGLCFFSITTGTDQKWEGLWQDQEGEHQPIYHFPHSCYDNGCWGDGAVFLPSCFIQWMKTRTQKRKRLLCISQSNGSDDIVVHKCLYPSANQMTLTSRPYSACVLQSRSRAEEECHCHRFEKSVMDHKRWKQVSFG